MAPRRSFLLLPIAAATSCYPGRHADGPSPAADPKGVYRIVAVNPLPALGSAISQYTALQLARYSGGGRWAFRCVSHLSPEQLLVPGDTPHTSGRSLFELTEEELSTIRVRLHEQAGRIASLHYLVRPGVDTAGEAELPGSLWIPCDTGRAGESGAYLDEDERAEIEQLMGEMIQKHREQAKRQQSRQPARADGRGHTVKGRDEEHE